MTCSRIFDRQLLRVRRDRAAAEFARADFLKREAGIRLLDRLRDLNRHFETVVDLGAHVGTLVELRLIDSETVTMISADLSPSMAAVAAGWGSPALAADEEALPFADGALDAVLSCLSLHWVNDLPGALMQIRRALKPDGLLLGSILGGNTLIELREVLAAAELELTGGVSPRVSPFADIPDLGGLLQRAGFALPVVDSDTLTVTYENLFVLMSDLRAMGETNVVAERLRHATRRAVLMRAADLYVRRFSNADGRIRATFQILTLTGWAPHTSQQKPLLPGSAQSRLADALTVTEIGTGDKPS